ncbi:LysM peptidoglycan-binding domain-containing protein [Bdellovibrio sp. HCB337]|uniref:LysM peptidoglycan-binding domain-containing protein n=1 Tax=Bdellovibrio sp. HCB337 TaxID=3394358 RepID=UPI0039A69507
MQKSFLKLISVATLATSVVAYAQDDADFKAEERFHRIYKKYNEAPTSEDSWEKALANRKANNYSVQNKDTLWDISNTLFGDSFYWPKVWSYNTDDILNPHQINPDQAIKFYAGTMTEAPTVGLAQKSDAPEALPTTVLEKKADGTLEGIKLPPPKRKSRPVVKNLPGSLPLYRMGVVNAPKMDFEISGARVKYPPAPKYLSVFATDNSVTAIGEVVELEMQDEQTTGEYQQVIVRISNAGAKRLIAFYDKTQLSDPTESFGNKGTVVEIQGELELMERVNEGESLFRAMVKKAINPVEVGAKLMAGQLTTFDSAPTAVSTSVQAKIIGGEYQRFQQKMFGTDNIIFLNAGAKEGLQEGSTLQVFMNERVRKPNTKAFANDRVIGTVKVIKLAEHFATAYVLDSTTDFMIGDYAGGRVKAANGTAASAADSEAFVPPADTGGGNGGSGDDFDLDIDTPSGGEAPPPASSDDELTL